MPDLEEFDNSSLHNDDRAHGESNRENTFFLGAIDIGTNSTHLLIASVDPNLQTFSVELAEKSTTRLGDSDSESGDLTELAMDRALEALKGFIQLAKSYQVVELVTAATSAVREAPNGLEFLERIRLTCGIEVDLVSGQEEARLIYLGVLSGMQLDMKPHLLIDIGGGSTEIILADGRDAKALTSTRLGAVRLQRDFIREEPLSEKRISFLRTFIEGSLEPAIEKVLSRIDLNEKPLMVGTSGTVMAIASLIASQNSDSILKLHGHSIERKDIDDIVQKLLLMSPDERSKLSCINERRSEIIIPGSLILQTAMKMSNIENIILSTRALREGLIFDWMIKKGLLKDRFQFQSNIRYSTVMHQSNRFDVNTLRSEYVAKHALSLYDNSIGLLHQDEGKGRELLWAASMLHACGKHINRSAYHKHSWYLIRHGELLGYSNSEHLIVAGIARYHRRSLPKKRHESWQCLVSKKDKQIVFEMSLLLRLASAFDRRADPVIKSLDIKNKKSEIIIRFIPKEENEDLSLERWSLMRCSPILKEYLSIDLLVK